MTSVAPEGEAFVQSFTNLRDFARCSTGGPALPVLRNDDYNRPVTQAGISFTQKNVGTGASRCDAFTSFVAPALHRKNLVVASGAHVRRVVLRPRSAQGEKRFEVKGVEVGSVSWTRRLARFLINDRDELKAAEVPAVGTNR